MTFEVLICTQAEFTLLQLFFLPEEWLFCIEENILEDRDIINYTGNWLPRNMLGVLVTCNLQSREELHFRRKASAIL